MCLALSRSRKVHFRLVSRYAMAPFPFILLRVAVEDIISDCTFLLEGRALEAMS